MKRLLTISVLVAMVATILTGSAASASEVVIDFGEAGNVRYDSATVEFTSTGVGPISQSAPVVREAGTNLVLSARLDADTGADGVADDFTASVSASLETSMTVKDGQEITVTQSTGSGEALIVQSGLPVTPGTAISVGVDAILAEGVGAQGIVRVRWRDAAGYLNGGVNDPSPALFTVSRRWTLANLTVPTGATNAEIQVGLSVAASGADAAVTLRNLQVESKSYATLFHEGLLGGSPVFMTSSDLFFITDFRSPSIIKDGDVYRMWFEGLNSNSPAARSIGYAESTDLIYWEIQNSGLPVSFSPSLGDSVGAPCVLKEDGLLKMWFATHPTSSPTLYYATSRDGISWTVGNGGQSIMSSCGNPCVVKTGSAYELWFDRSATIYRTTSSDGLTWSTATAVLSPVSGTFYANKVFSPAVVFDGNLYRMLFGALKTYDGSDYSIGYAESSNGLAWTVKNGGLSVLPITHQDGPAVLVERGVIKCLYSYDSNKVYFKESRDWCAWITRNSDAAVLSIPDGGTYLLWRLGIKTPDLTFDGLRYVLHFVGYDGVYSRIFRAFSRDGLNWTVPKLIVNYTNYGNGPQHPSAVAENGEVELWFDYSGDIYYVSEDGATPAECVFTPSTSASSPHVSIEGAVYKMSFLVSTTARYAESSDGLNWAVLSPPPPADGYSWYGSDNRIFAHYTEDGVSRVLNYGPFLDKKVGTFYASSLSEPIAMVNETRGRLWFLGNSSGTYEQLGYAEWFPKWLGVVGTKTSLDTSDWSTLASVAISADALDEDVRFLFSPNGYATIMTYQEGQWWTYYEGSWDQVRADGSNLIKVGMTAAELSALSGEALATLLSAGDSLDVIAIFNPDTEDQSRLESVTFTYDTAASTATYQVDNAHYDSSAWNAISHVYASLTQPEYAEGRFYVSDDSGATLWVCEEGEWSAVTGGTSEEIAEDAETLFATGMSRDELESIDQDAFASLLPASTFDLYAIQEIASEDTSGYSARFFVSYVEKYVFGTEGVLLLALDDGGAYTFDMTGDELQSFVEWCNLRERGLGPAYFTIALPTEGTSYTRITRRVYYARIVWFDINESN